MAEFLYSDFGTALILIDYDAPFVESYRAVIVYLNGVRYDFASSDVVTDFHTAFMHIAHETAQGNCHEVVFRDECNEFIEHSDGLYAYNEDYLIVRMQEVKGY